MRIRQYKMAAKRQKVTLWDREDVPYCKCPSLRYPHAHCPCEVCGGKAVSRSTEYRHWECAKDVLRGWESSADSSPDAGVDAGEFEADPQSLATGDTQEQESLDTGDGASGIGVPSTSTANLGSPLSKAVEEDGSTRSSSTDVSTDIVKAITKALNLMEDVSGSQQDFLNILEFGKNLYCKGDPSLEEQWPRSWHTCMNILLKYGYKHPQEFYVCLDDSHRCNYDVMKTQEDECKYCKKQGSIKYYYLPLVDKIRRWCKEPSFCIKMTAHWEERDHWLGVQNGWPLKKEIWDGTRFSELSWFWDPSQEWLLPVRCPVCRMVVSSAIIKAALPHPSPPVDAEVVLSIECPECYSVFQHCPMTACGDPRNIAFIGHWDGWQPFATSGKHSCGAIEITLATMKKADRSKTDEVYVCGFVPNYLLPNKRPCYLDPFILPIIEEVEELFIHGIEVQYTAEVGGIPPGKAILRCIILAWTGDYPAQCEVAKCINGGIRPCRRCKLEGTRFGDTSHYYFGDFLYHARYPWPRRHLSQSLHDMRKVDDEERVTVHASLAKNTGFTGLSILHRLHALSGFDVLQDTVFDAMHNIPLNVVRNHLHRYFEEKILSRSEVEKCLKVMPWTPELKSGRIPDDVTKRLGFWKAEEFQKFAFPASEYVLGGRLPDEEYHAWVLISRITELVFNTGRAGWTDSDIELLHKLVLRHNIMTEEVAGITSCVVTVHNLIHLPEDIVRFSAPDNFWCFVFERAVRGYVERSSNNKNLESTFANAECRREFLKFTFPSTDVIQPMPPLSLTALLHAPSLAKAQQLLTVAKGDGILVGGKHYFALPHTDAQHVLDLLGATAIDVTTSTTNLAAISVRSVYMPSHGHNGTLYRVGEHCTVKDEENDQIVVLQIASIFAANIGGTYRMFLKGREYTQCTNSSGEGIVHPYSGNPVVEDSNASSVHHLSNLIRKVMLYPMEDSSEQLVLIDHLRPVLPLTVKDVIVPHYPKNGDMVTVRGTGNEVWLAYIHSVDYRKRTCRVYFYIQENDSSNYTKESSHLDTLHWNSILELATGQWNGNIWISST